jgi:PadR family transcriptional regulator, regulatory protein AphA
MTELTPTGRVILGMIGLGKRTGYDIKALVDRSVRFFWAASYGQIYPELKRLEEDGLVRRAGEPEGGRRRTEYELTPAGEEALREWLASGAPLTFEYRDEGALKFFFSGAVGPEEALANLRAMRGYHGDVVAGLRELEPSVRERAEETSGPYFPYLTLCWGIEFHEWLASWCERTEKLVAEQAERRQ